MSWRLLFWLVIDLLFLLTVSVCLSDLLIMSQFHLPAIISWALWWVCVLVLLTRFSFLYELLSSSQSERHPCGWVVNKYSGGIELYGHKTMWWIDALTPVTVPLMGHHTGFIINYTTVISVQLIWLFEQCSSSADISYNITGTFHYHSTCPCPAC